MKIADARTAVLREWDSWAAANPGDAQTANGMLFYTYLQRQRADLVDFRASGDRWQVVHGWLLTGRRVKD